MKRPIKGQMSLIGDYYLLDLKYVPHVATRDTGECVIVLRLPPEATQIERLMSHKAAKELAQRTRTRLKVDYWRDKARDDRRRAGLLEALQDKLN